MSTPENMTYEGAPVYGEDPGPINLLAGSDDPNVLLMRIVNLRAVIRLLTDPNEGKFLNPIWTTVWTEEPYQEEVYECTYCRMTTAIDVADDYVPNVNWHKDDCPIKVGWNLIHRK